MHFEREWRQAIGLALLCLLAQRAAAINVLIDYTYDTTNFFGAGNPSGATAGTQAKAALEAAASFYSTILTDSFSPIQTPPTFHSSQFNGQNVWQWTASFSHPSTGSTVVRTNDSIAADQYKIYAGARSLSGSTAGIGGPGGFGWSSIPTGMFSPAENNQISSITATFQNQVEKRGQGSGFARWGGAITFDRDGSTSWYYNHLGSPSGSLTDFYSVAIHELGHALGFGASTQWSALVTGTNFYGVNAENQYNGNAIPLAPGLSHWAEGTMSVIYGSSVPQEAAMDPTILNGTRKVLTALDAGALQDIGWSLGPAPGVNGDYNGNGVVDAADYVIWRKRLNQNVTLPNDTTPGSVTAADYTVWRANYGKTIAGSGSGDSLASTNIPEPTTVTLAVLLTLWACFQRRRYAAIGQR